MDSERDAQNSATWSGRLQSSQQEASSAAAARDLAERVFVAGRVAARSLGMGDEESRDCACSFYLALARSHGRIERILRADDAQAYLVRCAHNFALDYARKIQRAHEHEIATGWASQDHGEETSAEAGAGEDCPICEDLWRIVEHALAHSGQRSVYLFHEHYRGGRTAPDLAAETGMSVRAVEQSLHRSLVRVREYATALFVRE